MRYLCILFLIVAIVPMLCKGQDNEIRNDADSARLSIEAQSKRVWKQSLILPGWGQITNGGLWWLKVPIIYGGFVTGVFVYNFNQTYYKEYLAETQYRIQNNDAIPPWSHYQWGDRITTDAMRNAKDYHRRNRDLTVLLMVGWWGMNAVEAYVSDMLRNRWNISEELSAKIVPTVMASPVQNGYSPLMGIKLQIAFDAGL